MWRKTSRCWQWRKSFWKEYTVLQTVNTFYFSTLIWFESYNPFFPLITVPVHLFTCGGGDNGIAVCHRLGPVIKRVGELAFRNCWCISPGLSLFFGVKPHYILRYHWSVGRVQPSQLILILKSEPYHGMSFTRPDVDAVQCGSVGDSTLLFEHLCELCSHVICSGAGG